MNKLKDFNDIIQLFAGLNYALTFAELLDKSLKGVVLNIFTNSKLESKIVIKFILKAHKLIFLPISTEQKRTNFYFSYAIYSTVILFLSDGINCSIFTDIVFFQDRFLIIYFVVSNVVLFIYQYNPNWRYNREDNFWLGIPIRNTILIFILSSLILFCNSVYIFWIIIVLFFFYFLYVEFFQKSKENGFAVIVFIFLFFLITFFNVLESQSISFSSKVIIVIVLSTALPLVYLFLSLLFQYVIMLLIRDTSK